MLVRIFSLAKIHGEVRHVLLDVMVFDKGLLSDVVRFSSGSITPLQTYGGLIKALVDNSMIEDALEFCLEAMGIRLEIGVPLCNSLLKCFIERNNVRVVRSLFEYMKVLGPSPNIYNYTTMMELYTKGNTLDVGEANKILVEMENHGVRPNAVTYNMYIQGLCKIGKAENVWEFLKDLQHKGLEYDNYCCNAVILSFCCKGESNKALTVLDEMKKCGLSPDNHSYNILVDGFCKEGNVSEAWNLFEEMHRRELMPNVITYTSLLHRLCSTREMETASKLFHELRDKGYRRDLMAYIILIDGCCQHGDLDGACELWHEMIKDKFTPDIFYHTSLIYNYCQKQKL
ncbi:uncharacterized protein A4U43_C01F30520 [Asparagus officinalis]|nr:uncharacterized protein A4U43_C01F30520 [Asparagus officinalis]